MALYATSLASSGCLVTDSPDFSPRARTRPELVAVTPTTEMIRAVWQGGKFNLPHFQAKVRSEDAGDNIQAALLIDYGTGQETYSKQYEAGHEVTAATLEDGFRDVTIEWTPAPQIGLGCHTVTMMVFHDQHKGGGENYRCPVDPEGDSATLTWFVTLCDDLNSCDYTSCPIQGIQSFNYCPSAEATP